MLIEKLTEIASKYDNLLDGFECKVNYNKKGVKVKLSFNGSTSLHDESYFPTFKLALLDSIKSAEVKNSMHIEYLKGVSERIDNYNLEYLKNANEQTKKDIIKFTSYIPFFTEAEETINKL